jgi:hypothetical protein
LLLSPYYKMLRRQLVPPGDNGNHRSRHHRLGNDPALFLRRPPPSADNPAAHLHASAKALCNFISVQHNDAHLRLSHKRARVKDTRSMWDQDDAYLWPNTRLDQLLPWNWAGESAQLQRAA